MLNHFDRSALLVLQYEQCRLDSRAQLRRTLDFIGLDDFEPPAPRCCSTERTVTPAARRYQPEARVRDAFMDTLLGRSPHACLADFPEIDESLWPLLRVA